MQVGVMKQGLSPTVQHGGKADLGAQVLRVGVDGSYRLARGAEQNAGDRPLVLISDGGNLFRYGENYVEILGVQQFRAAILKPVGSGERLAFGAVAIGTRVIGVALMAALITLFEMAPESRSPA